MQETLHLTPTESVTIVENSPQALVVEATYGPGGKPPPKHLHPAQDEHFEVLSGTLNARVGKRELALGPGETLDVPCGAVHQMWNASGQDTRVRWETRPAGRTHEWFRTLDAVEPGRKSLPAMAAALSEFDDVFRLAGVPRVLLRVVGRFGSTPGAR